MVAPVPTRFGTFRSLAERTMKEKAVPGAAFGIISKDEELLTGTGITNLDHPLPVDEHTLFQIGSISKTFTATAIMRLVDEGKLDLEAPVRNYLPEFSLSTDELSSHLKVWHLLTHVGGWVGDYFKDFGRGDDAIARMTESMHRAPQLTELGSVWSYNNTGFNVAGRVIEVVTGEVFEAVVKRIIFDPLGMQNTTYFAEEVVTKRVAAGHVLTDDGLKVAVPWAMSRSMAPAGGVLSCARDMLCYARFHLGDGAAGEGERILSTEAIATMQTRRVAAGSMADSVGVGWLLNERSDTKTVGHGGSTNGFQCNLLLVPARRFAIVILANSNHGHELGHAMTDYALEKYLDLAAPTFGILELTAAALGEYAGRYQTALSEITLYVEDGTLMLKDKAREREHWKPLVKPSPPPPARLSFYNEDRVVALDPPVEGSRGEFLRDAGGAIEWFRWGGRIARRLP